MNKTKPQRIDPKQVQQFFADARKRTSAARKNLAIDAETAYQIAYEAMIKGSLALMLSHGQRRANSSATTSQSLSSPRRICLGVQRVPFALFDRMRRKRNDAFYDIALVSDTEAQEAVAAAEAYLLLVEADLKLRVR
jgi:hypothetical protein